MLILVLVLATGAGIWLGWRLGAPPSCEGY